MSMTTRHNVGTCPGCRFPIWADVELGAEVSSLRLVEGRAKAQATAYVTGVTVAHQCKGNADSRVAQTAAVIADFMTAPATSPPQ